MASKHNEAMFGKTAYLSAFSIKAYHWLSSRAYGNKL